MTKHVRGVLLAMMVAACSACTGGRDVAGEGNAQAAGEQPASTPTGRTPEVVHITDDAIRKTLEVVKTAPKGPFPGEALRVADAGAHNVGVAIVHRLQPEKQSLLHDKVTEIYYVKDGGGTLLMGGQPIDPKPADAALYSLAGPGMAGTGIEGGATRTVNAGDIVIIPAGTPHMFTVINGSVTYLIFRIDPDRVLNLR